MAQNNQMFSRIVENKRDIIGMIAYCTYEFHVQEYCQKIEKEEERIHTISDIDKFISTITDHQFNSYTNEANAIVSAFIAEATKKPLSKEIKRAEDTYRSQLDTYQRNQKQLEDNYRTNLEKYLNELNGLKEKLNSLKNEPKSWYEYWSGVTQGIVASFLFLVIIVIIAMMFSAFHIDLLGGAKQFGEYLSSGLQKQSPPP